MAEEINNLLDMFVADMKQALDFCFDVLYDDVWQYIPDDDKNHINMARAIYKKHFAL